MTVLEKNQLVEQLEGHSQQDWIRAVDEIGDAIHAVDRDATRIWLAFWPLELKEALEGQDGPETAARLMDLEGHWRLAEQIDRSVAFLYGAHYWTAVKKTVLAEPSAESLTDVIRSVAAKVAESERVNVSLVLGISTVGLMMLRQVGAEALDKVCDEPAGGKLLPRNPEQVAGARKKLTSDGLLTFLRGVNRGYKVRWSETERDAVFRAINGQDIAMAGAEVDGDYRELDYRRIDGPVPVECRVGSCGYCWVGVLGGREHLSEMTDFERGRLAYFGYDAANATDDTRPVIRLACQAQCHGDVTLTIPSWNGELNRRHNEGPKKLGTA